LLYSSDRLEGNRLTPLCLNRTVVGFATTLTASNLTFFLATSRVYQVQRRREKANRDRDRTERDHGDHRGGRKRAKKPPDAI
jgi:hypothetical protein